MGVVPPFSLWSRDCMGGTPLSPVWSRGPWTSALHSLPNRLQGRLLIPPHFFSDSKMPRHQRCVDHQHLGDERFYRSWCFFFIPSWNICCIEMGMSPQVSRGEHKKLIWNHHLVNKWSWKLRRKQYFLLPIWTKPTGDFQPNWEVH